MWKSWGALPQEHIWHRQGQRNSPNRWGPSSSLMVLKFEMLQDSLLDTLRAVVHFRKKEHHAGTPSHARLRHILVPQLEEPRDQIVHGQVHPFVLELSPLREEKVVDNIRSGLLHRASGSGSLRFVLWCCHKAEDRGKVVLVPCPTCRQGYHFGPRVWRHLAHILCMACQHVDDGIALGARHHLVLRLAMGATKDDSRTTKACHDSWWSRHGKAGGDLETMQTWSLDQEMPLAKLACMAIDNSHWADRLSHYALTQTNNVFASTFFSHPHVVHKSE